MNILSVAEKRHRVLRWKTLAVNLDHDQVFVHGTAVLLGGAETSVLRALLQHRNLPLCKAAILDFVLGAGHQHDERLVDIYIARLRAALARAGLPNAIAVIAGRGYAIVDEHDAFLAPPAPTADHDTALLAA